MKKNDNDPGSQLLAAVLELTKNVSDIKNTVVVEVGAIRKELAVVHQEFREEIRVINAAIAEEKKITSVVRPLVEIWERKKTFVLGAAFILMLTGASFYGLIIKQVNEATGVSELVSIVKKNTETVNRLCAYLQLECK